MFLDLKCFLLCTNTECSSAAQDSSRSACLDSPELWVRWRFTFRCGRSSLPQSSCLPPPAPLPRPPAGPRAAGRPYASSSSSSSSCDWSGRGLATPGRRGGRESGGGGAPQFPATTGSPLSGWAMSPGGREPPPDWVGDHDN